VATPLDFGSTALWARVNALHSPWVLADLTELVTRAGHVIDVLMIPKVEGPEDIHYVDRLIAQLEAQAGLTRPVLIHAILETARGVANVEEICIASPRMQGVSLGPADLAADRQMKTTNVGGGHPGYLVRTDPVDNDYQGKRATAQQDLWHYTVARMVDACRMAGIHPYYGPFGDIKDVVACEDQFRNAYVMGCVGAWSLHPVQIEIARKVFTPDEDAVRWARRVLEVIPDGAGAAMVDGKMQDDASYKQCQAVLRFAELVAERDAAVLAASGDSR
jgi:malyl-CoA/(S)-citramalyl-CoA lyase